MLPLRNGAAHLAAAGLLFVALGLTVCAAEESRDPFVFGPSPDAPAQSAADALTGILWDATNPLAIVGGEPVGVGASVAGWQVVRIQRDGIEVQRGDRREFITPGSGLPQD
jgi:hypothetical protein